MHIFTLFLSLIIPEEPVFVVIAKPDFMHLVVFHFSDIQMMIRLKLSKTLTI